MTHLEPNHKFIEAWGVMASTWGVSRSESQAYALLLLRNEAMSADEIMQELRMSRGNTNAVLHTLMDYELVYKSNTLGIRKDFYKAETDLWVVMDKMMRFMKRRSLDKLVEMMDDIKPEEEISASLSHLEQVKSNIKNIAERFSSILDYFPAIKQSSRDINMEQGQIIQLVR